MHGTEGRLVTSQETTHPLEERTNASSGEFVTSVSDLVECLEAALARADDRRLASHAWTAARAIARARAAERRIAELVERVRELERLAITDALTGLLNRRGFEAEMSRAVAAAARYGEHGVLIYVDLDGFKPVNDRYGHAAGDAVLGRVAEGLLENVRGSDVVARLGGDEFVILLTRTDRDDGLKRAEAFDGLLNSIHLEWEGNRIAVRASLGIQAYGPDEADLDLLARADHAMYESKRLRADLAKRRHAA